MSVSESQSVPVRIRIVSTRNLTGELLARTLETEIGATCEIVTGLDDLAGSPAGAAVDGGAPAPSPVRTLFLIDCIEHDFDAVLASLAERKMQPCDTLIVAIYNVYPGWGIEEEALRSGVKGFFYKQDSLKLLLKGIKAILGKEVWVSREILMRSALGGLRKRQSKIQEETGLSMREIESLRLLGSGASNEEIAQKLFISTNTVKTHVYNIFKKIKVSSRLEAAAWAAKNL
jgi:LuxR family transcriptional regulator, positive regulator of biofilm formation